MRQPVCEIGNVAQGAGWQQFRRLQGDVSKQILDIYSPFHFSLQEKCQTGQVRVVEKRNYVVNQIGPVNVGFDCCLYQRK
ncbi:MAG: hypothetical protein E5V28_16585 [Mesorhizobium sp.]|nr:MAG: hypothetical protein EOS25_32030 [Mesorhizobium sp.]TIX57174.1 MAG: hypothetical protein E5V28_16585 [Mesorhizobium sp.]